MRTLKNTITSSAGGGRGGEGEEERKGKKGEKGIGRMEGERRGGRGGGGEEGRGGRGRCNDVTADHALTRAYPRLCIDRGETEHCSLGPSVITCTML